MKICIALMLAAACCTASAEDKTLDLTVGGVPWAKTVITPYDDSSKEARDETYKVYTHVMDFAGKEPITKGAGGLYPHHRGLFVGWRVTTVGGQKYDTWHVTDCYQRYAGVVKQDSSATGASQIFTVEWCTMKGKPFIREQRTIAMQAGPGAARTIDFTSELTALEHDTTLRGDSHHAGMQIRLSNELADEARQKETVYILADGAKRLENDEVSGTPWAVCNVSIGGKKYSVMHMTPPNLPAKLELYSIRPYARFGAFFEPDLKKGVPSTFTTRVIVSEQEITAESAKALYDDYAKSVSK